MAEAVDEALARARQFGLPAVYWQVRIDSPPGVPEVLTARGASLAETLDVLACDLTGGMAELPAPAAAVDLRWATDLATARDGAAVGAEVFGGVLPPEEALAASAERDREGLASGRGGTVVAYAGGAPVGSGGVSIVDGVARLWGGAVLPPARGQGVYRAVLAARLTYAAAQGATMALVKGRVETSGPILRRAGFRPYGRELCYEVPLAGHATPPEGTTASRPRLRLDHAGIVSAGIEQNQDVARFFASVLGCHVEGDGGYAEVRIGDATVALHAGARVGLGPHGGTLLHLASDDVDAEVAAIRARGGVIVAEPEDMPWGRSAYVAGPHGVRQALLPRASRSWSGSRWPAAAAVS